MWQQVREKYFFKWLSSLLKSHLSSQAEEAWVNAFHFYSNDYMSQVILHILIG